MGETTRVSAAEMARQRDFMEKVRGENAGREKSAFVQTYGCQQNENDSERLRGMLAEMGFSFADAAGEADLILLNTCAVRENAEQKVFGHLGALKPLKEARPGPLIALCGCMAQQAHIAERIRTAYPQVDLLFGTHAVYRFPELLYEALQRRGRVFDAENAAGAVAEGTPVLPGARWKANVSVMYGCNNFCSYCVVPYVRGRERSRKPNDILSEIARAAGAGAKEILLLGQNVNSYGKDLDEKEEKTDFAALLRKTAEVGGVERIRFVTSHPKDMTERLIDAIAETPKVCRALHLPFQAGSNAVLRAMNRGYTAEDYVALVEKIRAKLPGIALTSDVIVGFPGETEEDFADTLRLAEAARFDNLYTFLYSKRAGTPAAKMAGQIPPDVRQNRFDRLLALQARVSREINEGCVGKVFEILLEGKSKTDETQASGRTESGKIVHIPWEEGFRAGDFISVKITRAQTWALFGSLSPFTKSS